MALTQADLDWIKDAPPASVEGQDMPAGAPELKLLDVFPVFVDYAESVEAAKDYDDDGLQACAIYMLKAYFLLRTENAPAPDDEIRTAAVAVRQSIYRRGATDEQFHASNRKLIAELLARMPAKIQETDHAQ